MQRFSQGEDSIPSELHRRNKGENGIQLQFVKEVGNNRCPDVEQFGHSKQPLSLHLLLHYLLLFNQCPVL